MYIGSEFDEKAIFSIHGAINLFCFCRIDEQVELTESKEKSKTQGIVTKRLFSPSRRHQLI